MIANCYENVTASVIYCHTWEDRDYRFNGYTAALKRSMHFDLMTIKEEDDEEAIRATGLLWHGRRTGSEYVTSNFIQL